MQYLMHFQNCGTSLVWVPAHADIPGNEIVDRLAHSIPNLAPHFRFLMHIDPFFYLRHLQSHSWMHTSLQKYLPTISVQPFITYIPFQPLVHWLSSILQTNHNGHLPTPLRSSPPSCQPRQIHAKYPPPTVPCTRKLSPLCSEELEDHDR